MVLQLRCCSPELKKLASRLAARAAAAEPGRVAEERKKRNYADFWTPIAANEPFRVVLSHMRDRCVRGNAYAICEC
jgi:phosphoenolpyruvate carboxylase